MDQEERRLAYQADVTYGTNSEFGFDYLRDNLAVELEGCVQRGHPFAIVDEVDSILIDEARTPLIISGQPEEAPQTYYEFARIAKRLKTGTDYEVDEKRKTVAPSEEAVHKVERWLGIDNLYAPGNGQVVNHLIQALKAESLFHRDVEYVVQAGEVKIVDEFTGRIMEGRRWSEGLHQAVEAKEGVRIEAENVTVATVTIQNYFRMYEKLAGMTGTAATEATSSPRSTSSRSARSRRTSPSSGTTPTTSSSRRRRRSSPPSPTTSRSGTPPASPCSWERSRSRSRSTCRGS